jgi:hypothetical protein
MLTMDNTYKQITNHLTLSIPYRYCNTQEAYTFAGYEPNTTPCVTIANTLQVVYGRRRQRRN